MGIEGHVAFLDAARPGASDYSDAEIAERNAAALARSADISARTDDTVAQPLWDYNHVLIYGQALAVGQGCWPPKTTTARPGVFMLGDSVGAASTSPEAPIVGGAALTPLVATVLEGGRVLTPDEVARLPKGAPANGETPLEGALSMMRHLMGGPDDGAAGTGRAFVGSSVGIGGCSIAQLSKGATPNHFDRLPSRARQVKAAVERRGKGYGVVGLFLLQGEADYFFETTREAYKALAGAFFDAFVADASRGVSGQDKPPVVVTYQTGGGWAGDGLAIAQAQFEMSFEKPGWYLAAPAYPVTNKPDDHLEANGSRWLGIQLGKVWHAVVVERRGWRPTSPLRATWREDKVLVDFHVPCPPLQFRPYWDRNKPTTLRARGFSVRDADGDVTIADVAIVADALVALTCVRALRAPVTVSYGQKTGANGSGNLCDSDATVSPDTFTFDAAAGDDPMFDIAELVGRPYPLWNWCVAFVQDAEEDPLAPDTAAAHNLRARLLELAQENAAFAPDASVRPPSATFRLSWPALAALAVATLTILDLVQTASGRFEGEEIVPQVVNAEVYFQKRCRYRISVVQKTLLAGQPRPDAAAAGKDVCPPRYR